MRKDQLYNIGGFDPKHPSGNVLDEFVHKHPDDPTKGVTVKHYDAQGKTIEDRPLAKNELEFFFPVGGAPLPEHAAAVHAIANERVADRIA